MTELYYSFMNFVIRFVSGSAVEITGIIFMILSGWVVVKRRQFGFGIVLFLLSAATAFGSSLYVFIRGH